MPGIYTAALVAAALALAAYGGFLLKGSDGRTRLLLALLLLVQLPMSALAYYYLRTPLDGWLRLTITDREVYALVAMLYAPVTEEPAKLWPLLLPIVWRRLDRANAIRVAIALGLGFGIGEIAFLAERVAAAPGVAGLPWYAFGGFVAERVMVCLWHIAFTALTVWTAARRPGRVPLAFVGSVALHFVGNFPIYLAARNLFELGAQSWQLVLFGWVVVYFLAMALLLAYLSRTPGETRLFKGKSRVCRRCGTSYDAPLMGMNVGAWRYESCPACGKWQWA